MQDNLDPFPDLPGLRNLPRIEPPVTRAEQIAAGNEIARRVAAYREAAGLPPLDYWTEGDGLDVFLSRESGKTSKVVSSDMLGR